MDIQNTLKTIKDLEKLVLDGEALKKSGFNVFNLIALGVDVKNLVLDGQGALPELSELDPNEMGQIFAASYAAIKTIFAALQTP